MSCKISSTASKSHAPTVVCWVCGSSETRHWKARSIQRPLEPEDLRITDSHYGMTLSLWKCAECGFIFADGEEVSELVSLYERMSDLEYENSQNTRALQMRWLLKMALRAHPAAESLLDIGAGAGLLVVEAKRLGLDAIGVEPSRSLVDSARRLYEEEVKLLQGVFPHPLLTGRKFDLVFLVDIIEHVSNPVELLRHCVQALTPHGVVLLVTPDVGSLAARILGQRWWHFRIAHVGYFSRRSLTKMAEAAGLSTVYQARARWFFRVDYLAERFASYVPIGWLNRLSRDLWPLSWLYDRVIPLNMHDSLVVLLRSV